MAIDWLVTISAIRGYISQANQAQQQLQEANNTMDKAAQDLCSRWKGDSATAFAQEQHVLNNWVKQLISVGVTYISALEKAISTYEEAEAALSSKIKSR